jgi:hypothetical protein
MSLDVYLQGETTDVPCTCRHCGHDHTRKETEEFFSANITHNLGRMAREAGIYEALWRPDEIGITKASQLIEPLRAGIAMMRAEPGRFRPLSASNGWGTYEQFIPWVEKYLAACEDYPGASVHVSR